MKEGVTNVMLGVYSQVEDWFLVRLVSLVKSRSR